MKSNRNKKTEKDIIKSIRRKKFLERHLTKSEKIIYKYSEFRWFLCELCCEYDKKHITDEQLVYKLREFMDKLEGGI